MFPTEAAALGSKPDKVELGESRGSVLVHAGDKHRCGTVGLRAKDDGDGAVGGKVREVEVAWDVRDNSTDNVRFGGNVRDVVNDGVGGR